jgi:transposase
MSELTEHYRRLLGLDESWRVANVALQPLEKRVEITVEHVGGRLTCPECGAGGPQADRAEERTWRHLDTMQFETRIRAAVPRCRCPACGVKTIAVPWADKHARFTLLFEAFAVEVLAACTTVQQAADLLSLHWEAAHAIMQRAVARGLRRRATDEVTQIGFDEKSFGRGHDYVSVMTDLDTHRVLEVVPERTEEATEQLWKTLPEEQRKQVRAVAMDMWPAYAAATEKQAPQAEIVHDKFHVAKHLNEAVDAVRRREHRELKEIGDERLTGSKQLWLFNRTNLKGARRRELNALKEEDLKTSRAWAVKENFRRFWQHVYPSSAREFFDEWYAWAVRTRLKPIVEKAKMLKRHLPRLLSYFRHPITNAVSEGFNSRIQAIKSAARGFRNFENYRTRILFFCGKLDLLPET